MSNKGASRFTGPARDPTGSVHSRINLKKVARTGGFSRPAGPFVTGLVEPEAKSSGGMARLS